MTRTRESERARISALRARRQAAGNCIRCGLSRGQKSRQYCEKHREEYNAYKRARTARRQRRERLLRLHGAAKAVGL